MDAENSGLTPQLLLRWAADVFGDDRSRPWVSAGLIWPLADKLTANLAYAQQFGGISGLQLTPGTEPFSPLL